MSEAEREKLLDLVQTLELKLNSIEQVKQKSEKFPKIFLFRHKFLKQFSLFPHDFTNEEIRRRTMELEAKTDIV